MGQASDCYTTRSSPCPSPVYSKHRETPGPLSVPHSSHRAVRSFLGGACLFFRRQKLFASTILPPIDGHGRSSTGRIGGEMAWVAGSQPGCLGLLSPKLLPAVSETVPVSKVFPYIKDIKGGSPTEGIAARNSRSGITVQQFSTRLFVFSQTSSSSLAGQDVQASRLICCRLSGVWRHCLAGRPCHHCVAVSQQAG